MPSSSPYISFPGTAAEAFAYYADVFGGELSLFRYGDMPPMEGMAMVPPDDAVAHAELTGGLLTLAGGDALSPDGFESLPELSSDVYSFLLSLETVEAAQALIDALASSGGTVSMPFAKAPWGDHYGQVTDRYGVLFAVVVPGDGHAS